MSLLTHQSQISPTVSFWEKNSGITVAYSVSGLSGSAGSSLNVTIVNQTLTFPQAGKIIVFAVANMVNTGSTFRVVTGGVSLSGDAAGAGALGIPATASAGKNLTITGTLEVLGGTPYNLIFNYDTSPGTVDYNNAGLMVLFTPN